MTLCNMHASHITFSSSIKDATHVISIVDARHLQGAKAPNLEMRVKASDHIHTQAESKAKLDEVTSLHVYR